MQDDRTLKSPIVVCTAGLIFAATIFHATMVLIVNTPQNALKTAFAPVLRVYRGPEVAQGWALFAPRVDGGNTHVIIRARLRSGKVTGWYDATQYFTIEMRRNRFTPTRALAEVLLHSADVVIAHGQREPNYDALVRVATMVLEQYTSAADISAVQVELDRWTIPKPGSLERSATTLAKQLPWMARPDVATI